MRSLCRLLLLTLLLPLGGCFGYRLIRPDEVRAPSYEPREVLIPAECERMIRRAAEGAVILTEAESRSVSFCQHQQIVRAQEEEAAARRLESHAAAAGLAVQVTTVVVGALVAIIAWLL